MGGWGDVPVPFVPGVEVVLDEVELYVAGWKRGRMLRFSPVPTVRLCGSCGRRAWSRDLAD